MRTNPITPEQERHNKVMTELDQIKRYVAGIYQNVDTEINEMRDLLRRLETQIKDNDRQLDRMESYEKILRNIESKLKQLEKRR